MPISVVFDPPLPSDSPSTFNTKAFTLLGDLNDWSTQANALPGEVATNLTTLLASPPAIGSTTPAAGSFTTLSAVTINASGPIYGSAAGVRLPAASPVYFNAGLTSYIQEVSAGVVNVVIAPNEIARFSSSGLEVTTGTLGYGVGAGGTVTQATSKSTAVTLNKPSGRITMNNAALAAGAPVSFLVTNSFVAATDTVALSLVGGFSGATTDYALSSYTLGGSLVIGVRNVSAGSLSEALQIQFAVVKGATS